MEKIRFYFFGTPKFEISGKPVELTTAKAIALLAYLAVNHEPQNRERILGLLWADSANDAARKNLRNLLWSIRKTLGEDVIDADDDKLSLGKSVWTDVRQLEEIRDWRLDDDNSISTLNLRLSLYRAPLLDGLAFADSSEFEIWLAAERERSTQLVLRALDALAKTQTVNADWHRVIETAQRALAVDNLQEPMHRVLMQAHAQLGERAEALRQYDILRTTLERELGVTPLPETDELRAAIANGNLAPITTPSASQSPINRLTEARPRNATPFIGRTNECAALDDVLAIAQTGHARIASLVGELGIGKTRLWNEWSSHQNGVTILTARGLQSTQSHPFAPIIDLLGRHPIREKICSSTSPVPTIWLAQLARLVPQVRAAFSDLPAMSQLPPEEERQRLFESLAQCLLTLSDPIILFLDDAHWVDRATLDWIDYLTHRLNNHRLLIVVAYRAEDAPTSLIHHIASWGREGITKRISLTRLSPDESTALAALISGDVTTAERAQMQSAGNPYFLIELLRASSNNIPSELNDLVRVRIDRLDETARQIAQAAAILEPDFDFATIRRTSGRGEEETLNGLDTLVSSNILVERQTSFEFSHPLVATVLRDGMSHARCVFLHHRAAEALESTHANQINQIAGRLAEHYAQANDAPHAAHFAELAAENALALASPAEAIVFYHQAIALESTPPRQMGLGIASMRYGDLPSARAAFESALQGFQKANDAKNAVRACMNIAETFYPAGRFDEGREWMEKGLELLGTVTDPASHALAHLLLASSRRDAGQLTDETVEHARESIQIADENDLANLSARARFILGNLLAERGDLAEAIRVFVESAHLAHQAGDTYQQILSYNNAAYHALLVGDLVAARQYIDEGFALAQTHAMKLPLQYLYSTRGQIALAEKNWNAATNWFTRALEASQEHDNREQVADDKMNLAIAARGQGELDNALALLEQARQQAQALNAQHVQVQIDLRLAELYWERGERTAADESLTRAEEQLKDASRARLILWAKQLRETLGKKKR